MMLIILYIEFNKMLIALNSIIIIIEIVEIFLIEIQNVF